MSQWVWPSKDGTILVILRLNVYTVGLYCIFYYTVFSHPLLSDVTSNLTWHSFALPASFLIWGKHIRRLHCCYFIIQYLQCYHFCVLPADGADTTIARGRTAATAVYGGGEGLRSQHVSAIISAWVTQRLKACSDVYDAAEDTALKRKE